MKRIRRLLYQPESPRAALTPVVAAGILTITAALALMAWQAASARALPAPYYKWIDEDVAYIASDQERASFNNLRTVPEADKFIEQFWLRRAPKPEAVVKVRLEHYRRIAYSNERFAAANIPGWKTDRGRIYITFGPPDEIEDHSAGGLYTRPDGGETTTYPFQQWRYRHIDGVGDNIIMEFVDKSQSKDYRMTKDPHEKEGVPVPVRRPDQNGQLRPPPTIRFQDLKAAVDSGVQSNTLPMQVHADYLPVSGSSVRTDVTVRIENKDLQFQSSEGKRKAVLNLYGRITSMSSRPVNVFEDTIAVDSPEALFGDTIKKSSLYQKSIPLAPGEYRLNVVVRDVASGKMNNYEMALNVPRP